MLAKTELSVSYSGEEREKKAKYNFKTDIFHSSFQAIIQEASKRYFFLCFVFASSLSLSLTSNGIFFNVTFLLLLLQIELFFVVIHFLFVVLFYRILFGTFSLNAEVRESRVKHPHP
jgi:hypothetical protein